MLLSHFFFGVYNRWHYRIEMINAINGLGCLHYPLMKEISSISHRSIEDEEGKGSKEKSCYCKDDQIVSEIKIFKAIKGVTIGSDSHSSVQMLVKELFF